MWQVIQEEFGLSPPPPPLPALAYNQDKNQVNFFTPEFVLS